ncbi:MAG: ParB N-terminal domain-containing protein [bacterium]|nr:ParB N-terminal domain-containing protein [bacterium]
MRWKGNRALKELLVETRLVRPNKHNVRKHGKPDVRALSLSLNEHGQQTPIVVAREKDDLVLLAGEGTLDAALLLEWDHVAAVISDIDEEGQQRLYMLRDNRTAELSGWNLDELERSMRSLNDAGMLEPAQLWEGYEIKAFLSSGTWTPPTTSSYVPGTTTASGGGGEGGPSVPMSAPIRLTVAERNVIEAAVLEVRCSERDPEIREGRAVELICLNFLA